jgi:hypothetical protein
MLTESVITASKMPLAVDTPAARPWIAELVRSQWIPINRFGVPIIRHDGSPSVSHPRHCSHLMNPDLFISPTRSRAPNRIFAKITIVTANPWTARSAAAAS